MCFYDQLKQALDPNTDPQILESMSIWHSQGWELHRHVLFNPNYPLASILRACSHRSGNVRDLVTQIPHAPPEALRLLLRDLHAHIRWNAALHHNTPYDVPWVKAPPLKFRLIP